MLEPFPEADCYRVYRDVRASVESSCAQLGEGYNRYSTSPVVTAYLQDCIRSLAANGRLGQYGSRYDADDRSLFGALTGRRFGLDGMTGDDVFFTNGANEAISIATGALNSTGLDLVIPMPSYFAYEQSALRHGVPVRGRYRADGRCEGDLTGPFVAVAVFPNGVSGELFGAPRNASRKRFDLVDIVFQIAAPASMTAVDLSVRAYLKDLDLTRGAIILTPSKDLCVPAVRAGVVITRHDGMRNYLTRDRSERSFSISPLAGQLMIIYGAVVLLYAAEVKAGQPGFDVEYAWLNEEFARYGSDLLPSRSALRELVDHLILMAEHFERSMDILREYPDVIVSSSIADRVAGFSCFPQLTFSTATAADMVRWANHCGVEHGLKLNPTVLFGGTGRTWDNLLDGEARVRVNLSVPHAELHDCLRMLRACVPCFDRQGPSLAYATAIGTPKGDSWSK
jgi:hypothetical protein